MQSAVARVVDLRNRLLRRRRVLVGGDHTVWKLQSANGNAQRWLAIFTEARDCVDLNSDRLELSRNTFQLSLSPELQYPRRDSGIPDKADQDVSFRQGQ